MFGLCSAIASLSSYGLCYSQMHMNTVPHLAVSDNQIFVIYLYAKGSGSEPLPFAYFLYEFLFHDIDDPMDQAL